MKNKTRLGTERVNVDSRMTSQVVTVPGPGSMASTMSDPSLGPILMSGLVMTSYPRAVRG